MKINDIIAALEQVAPLYYQEDYDNAGLLIGNKNEICTGVMLCLDTTEDILDEAIAKGCNLVVAHHPIIFKGLKKITGSNHIEKVVVKAIENKIAIYAAHTNLDNVYEYGVNQKIATKLELQNIKILHSKRGLIQQLTVLVPSEHEQELIQALFDAGAGKIGNYEECSFVVEGQGTFNGNSQSNPFIGKPGIRETTKEKAIQVVFSAHLTPAVLKAMRNAHPYEEIAYYLNSLDNEWQQVGSGMLGELPHAMSEKEFLNHLKVKMSATCVRYTSMPKRPIKKVAVCGGSGSFLLARAKASGADAFVTADFKYHEFFDSEGEILIADIGHYESEIFTLELFHEIIKKKFPTFAVIFPNSNTNPIKYFF